jgi:hypothetical protein
MAIVWADTSPTQAAALAANGDVIIVPPSIKVKIVATRAALESIGIPAQWITVNMTNRQVIRTAIGIAQILQRCAGLGARVNSVENLDKRQSEMPANSMAAVAAAITSLKLRIDDDRR